METKDKTIEQVLQSSDEFLKSTEKVKALANIYKELSDLQKETEATKEE
jgi:hypothetical protein